MKPFDDFLCRFSLRVGAITTGLIMLSTFATVGLTGTALLLSWNSVYDRLIDFMGSNPTTGRNELLDHVYPTMLTLAVVLFYLYAVSAALLIVGVRWEKSALIKLYLFATFLTIVLCLMGHAYIFVEFTWYRKSQLIVTVVFNALWYIWWLYTLLVVLSFYFDEYPH